MEYYFIVINPRSTLTRSACTFNDRLHGSNRFVKEYSYLIGPCKNSKQLHKNRKYENEMNAFL